MNAAPELSADERATVARFEAAVEPEEIRVERVAMALEHFLPFMHAGLLREVAREAATAAIAALDPS